MFEMFLEKFVLLFFLLTPFAAVSIFLSMTQDFGSRQKRKIAIHTALGVLVITFIIFICGKYIFNLFGITVDAFRIGAGALLFLSAVSLIRGQLFYPSGNDESDIAIVPLAIPIIVGPGTTGALFVMSSEAEGLSENLTVAAALFLAVAGNGILLYIAASAEKFLKPRIMSVLTKVTGLILCSLAAQLILTGVGNSFAGKMSPHSASIEHHKPLSDMGQPSGPADTVDTGVKAEFNNSGAPERATLEAIQQKTKQAK